MERTKSYSLKSQMAGLSNYPISYDGIVQYNTMQQDNKHLLLLKKWAEQFSQTVVSGM